MEDMDNTEDGPVDEKGYPIPRRKLGRGWRQNPQRLLDDKRKAKFLDELSRHGIVGEAAKRASLHSHHGCIQTFYRERKANPEFARQWEEALEMARHTVEYELHRRAVEGIDEPIYYMGEKVGSVKKYSDQLLLARIRKLDPTYRETQKIEHGGAIDVKPIGLEQLDGRQRALLRELLQSSVRDAEARVVPVPQLGDTASGSASGEPGAGNAQDPE